MRPEDRAEMQHRLNQEELLIRRGFEPIPENGGELWISCEPGGAPELWTRAQALAELAVLDRGNRSHADRLTSQREHNSTDERGEVVGSNRPNRQAYRESSSRT